MKIICVGRNYRSHIDELKNETPEEPVVFMKPDTSILNPGFPFTIPEFSNDVHYEVELVVKISKVGKYIASKFAHKYYEQIGLGIDFTARDVQSRLKAKGLPWEIAKGFDNATVVGSFVPKTNWEDLDSISFRLEQNGNVVQKGISSDMIWKIDDLIASISQYFTLKTGDLIFTGTPAGVGPVRSGDTLEGYLEDEKMFGINVL